MATRVSEEMWQVETVATAEARMDERCALEWNQGNAVRRPGPGQGWPGQTPSSWGIVVKGSCASPGAAGQADREPPG